VLPRVVLFDLDGTLVDSAPGILASMRHALAAHGLPPIDEATARAILGPPFYETLPPLIGDVPIADVIATYRAHYAAGAMYDATLFAGFEDVLAALRDAGVRMAVATSKLERFAEPIVEHLGVGEYFDTVAGDEPDASFATKALVIGKVIDRLDISASEALMVGDRAQDVVGARAHGMSCLGAGWGYGLPGELEEAGAAPICAQPRDVLAALGAATSR
jgi:phosphoglycolate phosphatase